MATNTNGNGDSGLELLNSDYTTARNSLLSRVQARWTTAWNDFLANSFGRVMVDLIAWARTNITFTYNRLVAENFISTMQLRESAARIGSLVDYRLANPGPATVLCEALLSAPAASNVTIFKNTLVNSSNLSNTSVIFELSANYIIPQGFTYPQSQVLYIGLNGTGPDVVNSLVSVTAGSANLIVADSTVDLTTLISPGQVVVQANPAGTATYVIQSITNSAESSSNNQIVVSPVWAGTTGSININVLERRIEFVQGQTYTDNFTTASVVTTSQIFPLTQAPVIDGSSSVLVDSVVWTEVPSLSVADPSSEVYQIKLASNGTSVIVFGDGSFGALLPPNALIAVSYRVGGGTSGNVPLDTINTNCLGSDINGNPVAVAITNSTAPGEGGVNAETLQQARINIPAYINTNRRAVTIPDYATIASQFSSPTLGSVTFARATTQMRNALVEANIVFLYAWTTGPGGALIPLSPPLKTALVDYLASYGIGTSEVLVADGQALPTPIALRFQVISGFDIVAINSAVQAAITSYVASLIPGQSIVFSNVVNLVTGIAGVNSMTIATPAGNLNTQSSNQIFTPPNVVFPSTFDLVPDDTLQYVGQCPVVPLEAWAGVFTLNGNVLTMLPSPINGFALFVGPGLASQRYGPLSQRPTASVLNNDTFWYDVVGQQNYISNGTVWNLANGFGSGIELNTGAVRISSPNSYGSISLQLTLSAGYTQVTTVPLFISYTGTNSLTVRNMVRGALRNWNAGFSIGQSIFAQIMVGTNGTVLLDASRCNVADVVSAVNGVQSVNQVTLLSSGNGNNRIDVGTTSLIVLGDITINGNLN